MYPYPTGTGKDGRPIEFKDLLGTVHTAGIIAQIQDPLGTLITWGFGVTGGEVTVDATAKHRRQCRIDVVPYQASGFLGSSVSADQAAAIKETLVPEDAGSTMSPYGSMARIWYTINVPGYSNPYLGGNAYPWSLGLFRISSARVQDDGTPTLSIVGYDASRTISRNKLTSPWIVAAGTNWGDAIVALCTDRYPNLKARAHLVTELSGQVVVDPEQDPWDVVTAWGAAIGQEVFFDSEGWLVIRDEPDPSTSPIDWTYFDSTDAQNAVLLSAGRELSDEPGYNGVILTAESTTLAAPLRSEVWDLNPSSPTYADGPYGRVPKFVSNPYVATQAQCDAAAAAELQRSLGGTEQVSIAVVPNPAHEAGDVVRVVRPLAKIDHVGVVDSFSIPLSLSDAMQINLRARRSAS